MELAEVTKERDYYFEKLLDIEQVCQEEEHKASPLTERIFKILEQEVEFYYIIVYCLFFTVPSTFLTLGRGSNSQ
jgi:hypothetical protein